MSVDTELISKWRNYQLTNDALAQQINAVFQPYFTNISTPQMDGLTKTAFAEFAIDKFSQGNSALKVTILKAFRVLFRDLEDIDCLVTPAVPPFIISAAGLNEEGKVVDDFEIVMEACRCLVNGLKQSPYLRQQFIIDDSIHVSNLGERIITTSLQIFNPTVEQPIFVDHTPEKVNELLYLDLRIMFAVTALCREAQVRVSQHINIFVGVIHKFAVQLYKSSEEDGIQNPVHLDCIAESLKILFNAFYSHTPVEAAVVRLCTQECADLVKSDRIPDQVKQDAVNVLSLNVQHVGAQCPPLPDVAPMPGVVVFDGHDVTFVACLLDLLDSRMDEIPQGQSDLMVTFFGILMHLSKEIKAVRRYCRLRILPPLHAQDVEKPPEEGQGLRSKIIRLMMKQVGNVKTFAGEFLFILCKRSVSRMIKYCGFGHSAGVLADYGFLGRVGEARRASDSEDSETEDYRQVESCVNPVTGYIQPERMHNPFEGMTDEQKEHEAMKLANTMDKLLDAGVFMPGRIGPDGKPQAVSHVNELVKDVHIESDHSDED